MSIQSIEKQFLIKLHHNSKIIIPIVKNQAKGKNEWPRALK